MADWLMVIITTVYVIATIIICVFNGKTAKASEKQIETAKQQIDEMVRQYNEANRPYVLVRFEIIRSGLLCFIVENNGPVPAFNVKISICDDFVKGLSAQDSQARLREISESSLFLAPRQKEFIVFGVQSDFIQIAKQKAIIDVSYNGKYMDRIVIDLWQYRSFLAYTSELEDISHHLKQFVEKESNYHAKLLGKLDSRRPVSVLMYSADKSIKYALFRTVCLNPGSTTDKIAEMVGVKRDKALELLCELSSVDGLIRSLTGEEGMKSQWIKR